MLEAIFDSSIELTLYLQNLDWIIGPMKFFTFLGTEDFYSLVMPIIIWSIDYGLGMRVGIILLAGNSLNGIFKWLFQQPRPYWYDKRILGLVSEHSFGMPSGHSQNPASIYGLIAAKLNQKWVWVLALMLIFLIGLSRVTLGAHFSIDVVVGWIIGFLVLWAFLRLESPIRNWIGKQNFGRQIGSVFIFSLGLILLGVVVLSINSEFLIPTIWNENAGVLLKPFSLDGLVASAASLFGLVVGALWLQRLGGYSAKGEWWKRVLRFVVGLIGVLAILRGLDPVFPDSEDLLGYSFRYLRYGLMGFWVSGLAPWVFKRVGLAEGK